MKKIPLVILLVLAAINSFAEKKPAKSISGRGFYIGTVYTSPVRSQFDKYMTTVSDSLHLNKPLIAKHALGFVIGFVVRHNKGEFELGGSYTYGLAAKSNNTVSHMSEKLTTNTFDIHFGYSYYIIGPLFAGLDLGALSNDGKFTTSGNPGAFEETPESMNPFKGYIFFTRPKAGVFLPFKKGKLTGIKINAFYDLGVTKYDFYKKDLFQNRLKNYSGPTKTSFQGFGVQVSVGFING